MIKADLYREASLRQTQRERDPVMFAYPAARAAAQRQQPAEYNASTGGRAVADKGWNNTFKEAGTSVSTVMLLAWPRPF